MNTKNIINALYGLAVMPTLALSLCACNDDSVYGEPPIQQPEPKLVTVTGHVADEAGKGMANVVVSDGLHTTLTDASGNYSFKSALSNGYVFISTPNGFEPAEMLDGNRPKFWQEVTKAEPSDVNFTLKATPDKPLALLAIADPQISNRCGDVDLLKKMIVPDLNRSIDSLRNLGSDPIVLTVGDIICDYFVQAGNGYTLTDFNADFKVNAPVYHTIGNHDHDPSVSGDQQAAALWHSVQGPTYYSFNRAGTHFIVLDNMIYLNTGGKRNYTTGLTDEILRWVEADLEHVTDENTPIIVSMHGPMLTYAELADGFPAKTYRFDDGASQLAESLRQYKNVTVITGHAHKAHNTAHPDGFLREYNLAGANGGWWPASLTPHQPNLEICLDGAPWGYAVWNFTPQGNTQVYKAFNKSLEHQIRLYDLNTTTLRDQTFSSAYSQGNPSNKNAVLANIWNYEAGCKVRFIENGMELPVTQVKTVDPWLCNQFLYNILDTYTTVSGIEPEATTHLFRATASAANTPVTVEFTDRSGRKFTQTLNR